MTQIKNINGIKNKKCKCGSWIKHWEKYSGHTATYCATENCFNQRFGGIHVQKTDSEDSQWYIVPLCSTHAANAEELKVSAPLVDANIEKTCSKKDVSNKKQNK